MRGLLRRTPRGALLREEPGERPGRRTGRDPYQHRLRQDRRFVPAHELRPAQPGRWRAPPERAHHAGPPALRGLLQLRRGGAGPEAFPGQGRRGAEDVPGVCPDGEHRRARNHRARGRLTVRGGGRRQVEGAGTRCHSPGRIGRVLHRSGGGGSGAAGSLSAGHRVRRGQLSQRPLRAGPRPSETAGARGARLEDPPHLEHRLVPRSGAGTRQGRGGAAGGARGPGHPAACADAQGSAAAETSPGARARSRPAHPSLHRRPARCRCGPGAPARNFPRPTVALDRPGGGSGEPRTPRRSHPADSRGRWGRPLRLPDPRADALGRKRGSEPGPPPTSTPRSPRLRRSSCSAPRAAAPDPASS